jgi:hypothetical protein
MSKNKYVVMTVAIAILIYIYIYNKKNTEKDPVNPGKYSEQNLYTQITPMKHDIFKQLTVDLSAAIILGLVTQKELFNLENPLDTLVGKSLLSGFGFLMYYQFIQPYIINSIPMF